MDYYEDKEASVESTESLASATEYMDDDEHKQTMQKLYAKHIENNELLLGMSDSTEPSMFKPEKETVRPHIIGKNHEMTQMMRESQMSQTSNLTLVATNGFIMDCAESERRPLPIIIRSRTSHTSHMSRSQTSHISQPRASVFKRGNTNVKKYHTPQLVRSHSHNPRPVQHNYNYSSNDNELESVINHFWRVIGMRLIPFEILKISLKLKSIEIAQENEWHLLHLLLTQKMNAEISLKMFKKFIFDQNSDKYSQLRRKVIIALLDSNDSESDSDSESESESDIECKIIANINRNVKNSVILRNKSRFNQYYSKWEWRKALKLLVRGHWNCVICNGDAQRKEYMAWEQFNAALVYQCSIYMTVPTIARGEYVITAHSYIEWIVSYIDRQISEIHNEKKRSDDRTEVHKLLTVIGFIRKQKWKQKQTMRNHPFIPFQSHFKTDTKLKLLKAKSMSNYRKSHKTVANDLRVPSRNKHRQYLHINDTHCKKMYK